MQNTKPNVTEYRPTGTRNESVYVAESIALEISFDLYCWLIKACRLLYCISENKIAWKMIGSEFSFKVFYWSLLSLEVFMDGGLLLGR